VSNMQCATGAIWSFDRPEEGSPLGPVWVPGIDPQHVVLTVVDHVSNYAHFIRLGHSYTVPSQRCSLTMSLNCMVSCAPSLAIVTLFSPSSFGESCFASLLCN
jgi:hypothetical protein